MERRVAVLIHAEKTDPAVLLRELRERRILPVRRIGLPMSGAELRCRRADRSDRADRTVAEHGVRTLLQHLRNNPERAEGRHKKSAAFPDHIQKSLHDGFRAAFHMPQADQGAVQQDGIPFPKSKFTKRFCQFGSIHSDNSFS